MDHHNVYINELNSRRLTKSNIINLLNDWIIGNKNKNCDNEDSEELLSKLNFISLVVSFNKDLNSLISLYLRDIKCPISDNTFAANQFELLLVIVLRLMRVNRNVFNHWNLLSLFNHLNNDNQRQSIKLLSIYILSLGFDLPEHSTKLLINKFVTTSDPILLNVDYFNLPYNQITNTTIDLKNFNLLEYLNIFNFNQSLISHKPQEDLCIPNNLLSSNQQFIPTNNLVNPLINLYLAYCLNLPAILNSSPSSGKSSIINHLHSLINVSSNPQLLTIHASDPSLDPKSLLGSYVSTPNGTFAYVEGALVKALRSGFWVIIRDIEKASNDLLSIISKLAQSLGPTKSSGSRAILNIPGRNPVIAHENFRLFATKSSVHSHSSFLGYTHWFNIFIPEPSLDEISTIVAGKFPNLSNVANIFVQVWQSARDSAKFQSPDIKSGSERVLVLRDLFRWLRRVQKLLNDSKVHPNSIEDLIRNPIIQEEILVEAIDVFYGHKSSVPLLEILESLGKVLLINSDRIKWLINNRKVEFKQSESTSNISIGRCKLKSASSVSLQKSNRSNFALTRPTLQLMEKLAVSIYHSEPLLLVGETGTGKTTMISHLSKNLNRKLISLNLSHQTESSDLLGSFRPLDPRSAAVEIHAIYEDLFNSTFDTSKNKAFSNAIRKSYINGKWEKLARGWLEATKMARIKLSKTSSNNQSSIVESPRKKRKTDEQQQSTLSQSLWDTFEIKVNDFVVQHVNNQSGKSRFVFSYVEGPLVTALRRGDWILLDEVNLASPDTLECLSSLVASPNSSVVLTERGDLEPIPRNPDFRIFACMNPATDVGKRNLPPNLREKFTELYVPPPDDDKDALISIVDKYIGTLSAGDKGVVMDIAELYLTTKKLAENHEIADGSNQRPHFSMRTLTRALSFAATITPTYGLRRSLWEGWIMAFTMPLEEKSANVLKALGEKHIVNRAKNPRTVLNSAPAKPTSEDYLGFGHFWLERGPLPLEIDDSYILTPSVQSKLIDLARVVLTRRFPVLIQGPTSAGKTSAIEYLAKRTGHSFVRINNHEHTDLQEYLGTYVSDPDTGKFEFQEGILVRALRNGDWIVLDELNLAPTDVLEALNRLLDDNRELVIPETGEVVKPHPHFMLFATQNPPGLYAGRKILSRAFRNRFLEVQFDDVPQDELETILCQRCKIAPSYASKIVAVFRELQRRRQAERVFETKQSFATLRDLFRWANRDVIGYEQLAENGYMLLAERARRSDDKYVVKDVIENVMKVKIDSEGLYDISESLMKEKVDCSFNNDDGMVWTKAAKRLFILVAMALRYNEPVLLVGETGTGKTSVCQVLAHALNQRLRDISCHENIETADILGGQRPIRNRSAIQSQIIIDARQLFGKLDIIGNSEDKLNDIESIEITLDQLIQSNEISDDILYEIKLLRSRMKHATALFEWHDGPLVEAMRNGDLLLVDEISLADDAVLERLNSVLEPSRSLVLAEKGGKDIDQLLIKAQDSFKIIATMNPGGDFGKKELSPALRNRFTEIWVPAIEDRHDLELILKRTWNNESLDGYASKMLDFVNWFELQSFGGSGISTNRVGLRDLIAWSKFLNDTSKWLEPNQAFIHGAALSIFDGLQIQSQEKCILKAITFIDDDNNQYQTFISSQFCTNDSNDTFAIGPFSVRKGDFASSNNDFSFLAPTTRLNGMKVLRALQVTKPILLEGSPGVGKTSLIAALAKSTNRQLVRINLSDQTDLMDLFGSDLPVEGGKPGEFAWRDAAFLSAMQEGHWVLLDEMNLASQSVLEGLNAVLDHRGSVFLPELGKHFIKHPSFRVFAAQNPLQQGGGRKGLPQSFLNRFSKVYVQELSSEDLLIICQQLYPSFSQDILNKMIKFNSRLEFEIVHRRAFGRDGSPWEFNLRDILRWLQLLHSPSVIEKNGSLPKDYLYAIYLCRLRSDSDRECASQIYREIFDDDYIIQRPTYLINDRAVQIGNAFIERGEKFTKAILPTITLQSHLQPLEVLSRTFDLNWLAILVGPASSGKTSLARHFAALSGRKLHEFDMNAGVDTMELLGSFEQADSTRVIHHALNILIDELNNNFSVRCTEFDLISIDNNHNELRYAQLEFEKNGTKVIELVNRVIKKVFENPIGVRTVVLDHVNALLFEYNSQSQQSEAGRFEWVDGVLLRAMKNGDWLLIDDANLCSPSVLDRLNSLFESNGSLVLSERGMINNQIQTIKPHPNFRLIMALDPRHGELSRAMRNRGIEIYIMPHTEIDKQSIRSLAQVGGPIDVPLMDNAIDTVKLNRGIKVNHPVQFYFNPWTSISLVDSDLEAITKSTYPLSRALNDVSRDAGLLQFIRSLSFNRLGESLNVLPLLESQNQDQKLINVVNELVSSNFAKHNSEYSLLPISTFCHQYNSNNNIGYLIDLCIRLTIANADWEGRQKNASKVPAKELTILDKAALIQAKKNVPSNTHENVKQLSLFIQQQKKLKMFVESLLLNDSGILDFKSLKNLEKFVDLYHELEITVHNVHFDYSKMQVVLSLMKEVILQLNNQNLLSYLEAIDLLATSVDLKSGHGLDAIWSSLLPDIKDSRCDTLIKDLKKYRRNLKPALRENFIDVLATLGLSQVAQNVYELANDYVDELSSITDKTLVDNSTIRIDNANVALNVALETSVIDTPHKSYHILHVLLKRLIDDQTVDPISATGLRQAVWNLQVNDGGLTKPIYLGMLTSWMARTWSLQNGQFSGPADLFRPMMLRAISERCSRKKKKTINDISDVHQYLKKDAQALTLMSSSFDKSRYESLRNVLVAIVLIIFDAFSSHIDVGNDKKNEIINNGDPKSVNVEDLKYLASKCQHDEFRNVAENILCPSLNYNFNDYRLVSKAWIEVSVACLNLYIPNFALDPAVPAQSVREFGKNREERLIAELNAAKEYERITTGNETSKLIEFIQARLDSVKSESTFSTGVTVHRSSDLPLLTALYQEIHHFANQTYASKRFIDLLNKIEVSIDEQLLFQEETIQSNIEGFLRRLDGVYAFYEDLIHPIRMFLHMLKIGLRTFTQSCRVQDTSILGDAASINSVVDDIARFPTVSSFDHLRSKQLPMEDIPNSENSSPPTKLLLIDLSSIAFEVGFNLNNDSFVERLDNTCASLFERWDADRKREQMEAEENASLYKPKTYDEEILNDEEAEEKDFRLFFPEYEDVLNVDNAAAKAAGVTVSDTQTLVNKDDILAVYNLHFAICANIKNKDSFNERRLNLIQDSVLSTFSTLSSDIDKETYVLQTGILANQIKLFESNGDLTKFDFYHDASVSENKLARDVVHNLSKRLEVLYTEWPDQIILQHLNDRCKAILRMDYRCPLAEMLNAIETLLMHTEDWESHASRDVSLRDNRDQIVQLIVKWRRMELSTWASLLERQKVTYKNEIAIWWFRFYEVIIHGLGAASENGNNEDVDKHLSTVVELLDRFLYSSYSGHYTPKLQLVKSFSVMLELISTIRSTESFTKASKLLDGIYSYYQQFEDKVNEVMEKKRDEVEKNIQDWIKIASWKDVNVFALRASAHKTHRQLHKSIRVFRDVLNKPVESYLTVDTESQPKHDLLSLINSRSFEINDYVQSLSHPIVRPIAAKQAHLNNLSTLFEKLQQRFKSIESKDNGHEALEEFSNIIIETSNDLRKQTPMHITEENSSSVKSLTNQKHKALSDLLKELKRLGLSPNLRADLSNLLRDSSKLFQLPNLTDIIIKSKGLISGKVAESIPKIDSYHYRILALLPRLRASLSMHADDISTRDLSRALSFVESSMAINVKNREIFSKSLKAFFDIQSLTSRLMRLNDDDSSQIVKTAYTVKFIKDLCEFFTFMKSAFNDVLIAIEDYNYISKSADVSISNTSESVRVVNEFGRICDDYSYKLADIHLQSNGFNVFTKYDDEIVKKSQIEIDNFINGLLDLTSKSPFLSHIFKPTIEWVKERKNKLRIDNDTHDSKDNVEQIWLQTDNIINGILIVAQSLEKSKELSNDDLQLHDNTFNIFGKSLVIFSRNTRIDNVIEEIKKLFTLISESIDNSSMSKTIMRIIPFIHKYSEYIYGEIEKMINFNKSSLKLTHVLSVTFLNLSEKGFCKPDEKDEGEGDQGEGKLEEGTGIGEGEGEENISNQIQNEEQVEGLKNDNDNEEENEKKDDDENKKTEAEDQAIEMNEDFEGDLDDASDREEGNERDENEIDDEVNNQNEKFDPEDVDEKMWGDNDKKESDDHDDHVDNDSKDQQGQSETVANENENEDNKKKNEDDQGGDEPNGEDDQQKDQQQDEQQPAENDENENEENEGAGDDKGDHKDNELPEPEMLDLPEGMELDNQQKDKEIDDDGDDEGFDDDEMNDDLDMKDDNDKPKEEGEEGIDENKDDVNNDEMKGEDEQDENDEGENNEGENDENEVERNELGEEGNENDENDEMEENKDQDQNLEKDKANNEPNQVQAPDITNNTGGGMDESSKDESGAAQATSGQQAENSNENIVEDQQHQSQNQQSQPNEFDVNSQNQGQISTTENIESNGQLPQNQEEQNEPNPLRSLGDAMKEFRRRFDEIAEANNKPNDENDDTSQNKEEEMGDKQLEYVKEGEENDEDLQALGGVREENVDKLNDLQIADEKEENENEVEMNMEEDDVKKEGGQGTKTIETEVNKENDEVEDDGNKLDENNDEKENKLKDDENVRDEDEEMEMEIENENREEVEEKLIEWTKGGEKRDSKEIWKSYENMTRDLSYGLCEQLRLILEPTLATRLKGDYRTGKRLNMKKIIPYIASEFTKDKIWLRRTRPSKREYQVLLAMDDSKSMSDVHTIHLAFQSLVIISKALSTLEVGSISIAKFGKNVDILHEFDSGPFTDEEGSKVIDNFTFSQNETNVHSLIENSLEMLSQVRENGNSELNQLMFVLSDGICSNHEKMNKLIRKAQEDKVMIVFVVLDSLKDGNESILNMTQASYKLLQGKPQLSIERYLDSFPFKYYVVVRNIDQLPSILSTTLKQWIEVTSMNN